MNNWIVLGIRTLSSADALAGMAELIAASAPHGMVARIDWTRFVPFQQLQRKRSLLAKSSVRCPRPRLNRRPSRATPLIDELEAAARPAAQATGPGIPAQRCGGGDADRSGRRSATTTGFFDLGMDSLMAVELHRRLEKGFGRQLPVTLAMDHPHLTDAAEYLRRPTCSASANRRRRSRAPVVTMTARTSRSRSSGWHADFPGARDAEAFWNCCADGVDMIREIPDDRYDINDFYDPDPDAAGKIYTRYGGFLDGIDGFDPEFFGISPREAVWIDPQQRLVLETAWEGLERAGYRLRRCAAAEVACTSASAPTNTHTCCPAAP